MAWDHDDFANYGPGVVTVDHARPLAVDIADQGSVFWDVYLHRCKLHS